MELHYFFLYYSIYLKKFSRAQIFQKLGLLTSLLIQESALLIVIMPDYFPKNKEIVPDHGTRQAVKVHQCSVIQFNQNQNVPIHFASKIYNHLPKNFNEQNNTTSLQNNMKKMWLKKPIIVQMNILNHCSNKYYKLTTMAHKCF